MFGLVAPPATLGVPSPKFQLNEYGVVPPDAVAVKLTDVFGVYPVGAVVKTTASARGEIVINEDAVFNAPLASVAFTLTVNVPLVL